MKLDILVFAAHPDDAELGCGGTIAYQTSKGRKVGIIDLTQGEMGTRGTIQDRANEAADSAKILGISVRENLKLSDVFFNLGDNEVLKLVRCIRQYQPELILANAISDRHPDHGKGAEIAFKANFWAGLKKIESRASDGSVQKPWRAKNVYNYIQSNYIEPDFIVDTSEYWDQKIQSIKAFKSQFFDPNNKEANTFISSPRFLKFLEARSREFGQAIGADHGEGFTSRQKIGVKDIFDLQ